MTSSGGLAPHDAFFACLGGDLGKRREIAVRGEVRRLRDTNQVVAAMSSLSLKGRVAM
jgi:hypothetical protein